MSRLRRIVLVISTIIVLGLLCACGVKMYCIDMQHKPWGYCLLGCLGSALVLTVTSTCLLEAKPFSWTFKKQKDVAAALNILAGVCIVGVFLVYAIVT